MITNTIKLWLGCFISTLSIIGIKAFRTQNSIGISVENNSIAYWGLSVSLWLLLLYGVYKIYLCIIRWFREYQIKNFDKINKL